MKLSQFGRNLTRESGIVDLMEDLGDALNVNPNILFLGGGNPAQVPEFEQVIAQTLTQLASQPDRLHKLVGVYQSPRGSEEFIARFVDYVNTTLGWGIKPDCVALTHGSQSAFYILFNILSGLGEDGALRKIVFPMMPEYLGYADQVSESKVFRSYRPQIEQHDDHRFKYKVDFDQFCLNGSDAAVCFSSPTNPTGNVLTANEVEKLHQLAQAKKIPLIIDCAYGGPFPGIVFDGQPPPFFSDSIYVISCSKLGLPGARTGIVVGPADIVQHVVQANTLMSLANGNFGPTIVGALMESDRLSSLCRHTLLPFYRQRRDFALACVDKHLKGLPYLIHESEGAFFLWIWFPQLPISSTALYEKMKEKGVLIMDGSHFFFGLDQPWSHSSQCIRLTFCQSEQVIDKAISMLAGLLRAL